MSLLHSFFLILHFLNIGAGNGRFVPQLPPGNPEVQGSWVAEQIDKRDTGRDSRTDVRMRLFDRQGRVRERAMTLLFMRGGQGRPTPGDRTLVRFTSPADINGTGLLVWEQPAADDERFLYLPSLGRVRRIAGAEAQESFAGSDFSYEDIGGRELERYTYTLLDQNATWKAADGTDHPAYRLQSTRKDSGARWPRVVSLVRRDNFIVVQAEVFNRRDESQKHFEVKRVERLDGYWTVLEMHMADQAQRTRTELVVDKAEYDTGLTADSFSRRELERVSAGPARSPASTPRPR